MKAFHNLRISFDFSHGLMNAYQPKFPLVASTPTTTYAEGVTEDVFFFISTCVHPVILAKVILYCFKLLPSTPKIKKVLHKEL